MNKISNWFLSFFYGVRNLYNFFWVIWKFRRFDYMFGLEVYAKCLKELKKGMYNSFTYKSVDQKKLFDVQTCINIIYKLDEDNPYIFEAEKELNTIMSDMKFETVKTSENLYRLVDNRTEFEKEKDHQIHLLVEELREEDKQKLFNTLKDNIQTWWC